jgi:hypothetical protein
MISSMVIPTPREVINLASKHGWEKISKAQAVIQNDHWNQQEKREFLVDETERICTDYNSHSNNTPIFDSGSRKMDGSKTALATTTRYDISLRLLQRAET